MPTTNTTALEALLTALEVGAEYPRDPLALAALGKAIAAQAKRAALESSAPSAAEPVAWRPVETAPKDGTLILLRNRRGYATGAFWAQNDSGECGWVILGSGGQSGRWNFGHAFQGDWLRHWMPIPPVQTDASNCAPPAPAPSAASEREALADEREAFEAWLVANDGMAERLPDGDYESWFAGHAWEGWQARAALHSIGDGEERAGKRCSCGAVLTAEEIRYYGVNCESCEAAESRAMDADMLGAAPRDWPAATADAPVAEPVAPPANVAQWIVTETRGQGEDGRFRYTDAEMRRMQESGTLPRADAWLVYCDGEPAVPAEIRKRFCWSEFHSPVWMPLVYMHSVPAQYRAARPPAPEDAKDAARLDALSRPGWELSMSYDPEVEPCQLWQVHRCSGGRNDREWTLLGAGATPREAIDAALSQGGGA